MSVTGEQKIIKEDGQEKPAFVLSFTNGALAQLDELTGFFKKGDKLEAVKMAISLMQFVKEEEEKKKSQTESK